MATLSLKNINKIYPNKVQAVFDFNLDIKDKEFIVFVGPSGCGKSTTLRMVAGLEEISSGELYIDGELMNHVAPKDRNIAMVFQSYALYPHMTVYENMKFALKLRKANKPLYLPNPDVEPLKNERKEIRNEIAHINHQFKKKQDASELLEKRAALYADLYKIEDEIESKLVIQKGIDNYQIKQLSSYLSNVKYSLFANEKRETKIIINEEKENELKAAIAEKNDLLTQLNDELKKTDVISSEYKSISAEIKFTNKELKKLNAEFDKIKNLRDELEVVKSAIVQKNKQIEEITAKIEFLKTNEVDLYRPRHLTYNEMDIEINKVAESIDLIRYLFRKPSALSGGQRQRVALGRAIVRKPKVFLMDEPLSNLDAKLRVQTRSEITKIHDRVGATTIYVTHDQTEAMTMADRIVVMKDGYIQQIGTPDELYEDPTNKFVAGFIGSPAMNFIKGTVEKDKLIVETKKPTEGKESVDQIGLKELTIKLTKEQQKLLKDYEGKSIYYGIRPEEIYFAGDANNKAPSDEIKCNCDYSELLGYELIIYTYFCGQKVVSKISTKKRVNPGDEVKLAFNTEQIYFFDAETEQRIK